MWLMDGATTIGSRVLTVVADPLTQIVGVADFDANGKFDIIWRNYASGNNQMWFMNGLDIAMATAFMGVSDTNARIVGVSDFDANRRADIVWHNFAATGPSAGLTAIWFMFGNSFAGGSGLGAVAEPWQLLAPR